MKKGKYLRIFNNNKFVLQGFVFENVFFIFCIDILLKKKIVIFCEDMFWKIYLSYSPRTYRVSQRKVKIEQNVVVLFCEDIFWKMFSSLVML